MHKFSSKSGHSSFPGDFLFGAATSSHQVEGDNRWNDWWEYETTGQLPFESGRACDHYNRYEADFDLAQSWGHNCHRLSIEWSRIEPNEGEWNEEAVQHYIDVFAALRQRGLEPIVTLNHFTLPAWFLRSGGWTARSAAEKYATFVARFVAATGDRVCYWMTINEPTVYVQQSYLNGEWPPLKKGAWREAVKCFRHLARAHCLAYQAIKRLNDRAMVGFAHSAMDIQPCNPERAADRSSSKIRNFLLNRLFFRMIGAVEGEAPNGQQSLDFVGINYYTRCSVKASSFGLSAVVGRACKLDHHADSGVQSSIGWETYPKGLGKVLDQFSSYGLPMLVTENGIATDDDELRCRYLEDHLKIVARALAEGKSVLGYVHWSLMDNFEWHHGYAPRFGLAEVNFNTMERKSRPSAKLFAQICQGQNAQVEDCVA
ncbi:MAG: glycoside hydrolase family 1 protein [Woeseiaceae bacterium]